MASTFGWIQACRLSEFLEHNTVRAGPASAGDIRGFDEALAWHSVIRHSDALLSVRRGNPGARGRGASKRQAARCRTSVAVKAGFVSPVDNLGVHTTGASIPSESSMS
jgi:hypothetical protein